MAWISILAILRGISGGLSRLQGWRGFFFILTVYYFFHAHQRDLISHSGLAHI